MQAEIVAIGNEVLEGFTLNTNGAYIAQEFIKNGFGVARQQMTADDPESIKDALNEALQRADLVIATGGLGPTGDDLTRSAIASLFDSNIEFIQEAYDELVGRYSENFPSLVDQSTLPIKARRLPNKIGTAFGLVFEEGKKLLIVLPGVPQEMRPMFSEQVVPFLKERFIAVSTEHRWLHFARVPESAIDPHLQQLQLEIPNLCYGIYPSQGIVSVHLFIQKSEKSAEILNRAETLINTLFHHHRFFAANGKLEEAVYEKFMQNGWTLSAAESCTGGAFSARLTALAGASNYFLGSVVCYSNAMKIELLNVLPGTLADHGAVSHETVIEMLQGILKKTGSEFAVAASGIAGPDGGSVEKPVGTVVLGICRKGQEPQIKTLNFRGTRSVIIERSVNYLLSELIFSI